MKNNLAEDGTVPGLAFELVEGRIRWRTTETVPELAEVLLPSMHNNDRRRLRRAACEWLQEALADGPMPSGEVVKQALSCGISKGTLTRAISDLGIKSHKTGFNGGWEMRWTPRAPRRLEPPSAWTGGLRIVGAELDDRESEEKAEGGRQKAEEASRIAEYKRQEAKVESGEDHDTRASCAPSEGPGHSSSAGCASSKNRGDSSTVRCDSSEEWKAVAGAGRPHPSPLPEGEGVSCDSSEAVRKAC